MDFSFWFPPAQFWKLQQQGFEEEKEADKARREWPMFYRGFRGSCSSGSWKVDGAEQNSHQEIGLQENVTC